MQVEARLVNKDSLNKNNSLDLASSICTISQDHSSLFIIVVNLVFVISLRCIDWVREPLCEQNVIYIFSIKNCIGTEGEQGRIQDFRNGGSDLLRGFDLFNLPNFPQKIPMKTKYLGLKGGFDWTPRTPSGSATGEVCRQLISVRFLFLLVSGIDYGLWLWHSLDFSNNFFKIS